MSKNSLIHLTISIPAFNEESSINEVVRQALLVLDKLAEPSEVLILNDASTDRTAQLLDQLSQKDTRVRILTNEANQGVGGFSRRLTYEARGEWIFIGSADGETDFNNALDFLKLAKSKNLDAVLGYRSTKNYTLFRQFVSWGFKISALLFFGAHFKDLGWVQLYRAQFFQSFPLYSHSPFTPAERLLIGKRLGGQFTEVPVSHLPRIAGQGRGANLRWILKTLKDVLHIRLRWFFFDHYYKRIEAMHVERK